MNSGACLALQQGHSKRPVGKRLQREKLEAKRPAVIEVGDKAAWISVVETVVLDSGSILKVKSIRLHDGLGEGNEKEEARSSSKLLTWAIEKLPLIKKQ